MNRAFVVASGCANPSGATSLGIGPDLFQSVAQAKGMRAARYFASPALAEAAMSVGGGIIEKAHCYTCMDIQTVYLKRPAPVGRTVW